MNRVLGLIVFGFVIFAFQPLTALTITVNSTSDEFTIDSQCTLREAVAAANSNHTVNDCVHDGSKGTDTIKFSSSISYPAVIILTFGNPATLVIQDSLKLQGPLTSQLTIDGNFAAGIFEVASGITVNISNLTIANGVAGLAGGGIQNQGILNMANCTLQNNFAENGGGIYNTGTLNVTGINFLQNSTDFSGGAIFNSGALVVRHSSFSFNLAQNGAAIFNKNTVTVRNSTFFGNDGIIGAGTQNDGGTVRLSFSTFSRNFAHGGGTIAFGATLKNTIVADSGGEGGNCLGTIIDGGNNLQFGGQIPGSCGNSIPTPASNPLGNNTLADNGGPTQTIALPTDSAAIDAGNNSECGSASGNATDQRGVIRPQGVACDIGAFELGQTCNHTKHFWKTHPSEWPVSTLTLGDQTYPLPKLLDLLSSRDEQDASLVLARELIIAKLNFLSGAEAGSSAPAFQQGDLLLSGFPGKLPYNISRSSDTGKNMISTARTLKEYNSQLCTQNQSSFGSQ